MSDLVAAKRHLAEFAFELGFADLRVAQAQKTQHFAEFDQWLEDGKHADMAWLADSRAMRQAPQNLFAPSQRVIVLAHSYFCAEDFPRQYQIARYARGRDYHRLLRKKMQKIINFLAQNYAGEHRAVCDSAPLMERDFASAAGLGWNGKSKMQIHPQLGAWFLLSEILTSLPLPVDAPYPNRCGSCTRCITACPTAALDDGTLDARKCISYWTIEHHGAIPIAMRQKIGTHLFGCDDCAAICPWNRFAKNSTAAQFAASKTIWREKPLAELLQIPSSGFAELFAGSPIRRTGWRGFMRNICIALGNLGKRENLPALENFLAQNHSDEILAEHANWAITEINSQNI